MVTTAPSGRGPGGVAASERRAVAPVREPIRGGVGQLAPCDTPVQLPLDELLAVSTGTDRLVLKALKPVIRDKLSLAPVHYQASLAEVATVLARAGTQRGQPELTAAAELIGAELELMNLVASRRGLIARG